MGLPGAGRESLTMCVSALAAAALAAGGTMAVTQLMKPKTPSMPTTDPAAEKAKLETDASQAANSKLAAKNRARAASSLLAKPLDSTTADVAALGGGKTTLGQ